MCADVVASRSSGFRSCPAIQTCTVVAGTLELPNVPGTPSGLHPAIMNREKVLWVGLGTELFPIAVAPDTIHSMPSNDRRILAWPCEVCQCVP